MPVDDVTRWILYTAEELTLDRFVESVISAIMLEANLKVIGSVNALSILFHDSTF